MKTISSFFNSSLLFILIACSSAPALRSPTSTLEKKLADRRLEDHDWYKSNAEKLKKLIHRYGKESPEYNPHAMPVATFDWDNTVMKNDAGDAIFFFMIANDLIKSPADWASSSDFLTPDAITALNTRCRNSTPGTVLTTSKNISCADLLLSIYDDQVLPDDLGGKSAWLTTYNPDTIEPAYAWDAQIMAGYTPNEIREFAKQAMDFNLNNPIGTQQNLGSKQYTAWVRVYDQIKDLVSSLKRGGFDVWVVTASPQSVIEIYAAEIGVAPDHVVGIRSTLSVDGKITAGLQACGTNAEGDKNLITYRQGKRCWINQTIFGMTNPNAQMNLRSPTIFAAGDSDTDVYFVKDAVNHLVINRNKPELMCNAYADQDQMWIINPMFIEPLPQKTASSGQPAYSCKAYGLPDQMTDSVYAK